MSERQGMTASLAVCRGCDRVYNRRRLGRGEAARCALCGTYLYGEARHDPDAVLAFSLSALVFLVLAHSFPLMTFEVSGRSQTAGIIAGALGLYREGFPLLAGLVVLTGTLFPFAYVLGLCYALLAGRDGGALPHGIPVFRLVNLLPTWAMLEVYVIAAIVAYVKLEDFGSVRPQSALLAVFLAATAIMAARFFLDPGAHYAALQAGRRGGKP